MTPILFDQAIFLEIDGQVGSYGKDEIKQNHFKKINTVTVACLDVTVKTMPVDASLASIDLTKAQSFDADSIIIQERMAANCVQLLGVSKEKIEEIYGYFKDVAIESIVPYQVAVRAFLKAKSFLMDDKAVIFVDDVKTMTLITVFHGQRVTDARRVSSRDLEKIILEIKRTWQGFSSNFSEDVNFTLVCNNHQWLESFKASKTVSDHHTQHMDTPYPVLEGLGIAKFPNGFILPKDLARLKKQAILRKYVIDMAILSLCIAISLGVYTSHQIQAGAEDAKLRQAITSSSQLRQELAKTHERKLLPYLQGQARSRQILSSLLSHLPINYHVEEFSIQTLADHQRVSAFLVPNEGGAYAEFNASDIWKSAEIKEELVNDQMGIRVNLNLS